MTATGIAETKESKSMYGSINVKGTSGGASMIAITAEHIPPYMNVAVWERTG